ncbi:MAG: IS1 family transposase [SAR324 cluster bacterium]|nr:IS1 family transposase [SAR324 cluster bacterium]
MIQTTTLRGVERALGISRQTVVSWIKKIQQLPELKESLDLPRADDILELDELWSFVRIKTQKRWLWIALCRHTRQVIAFAIGDRSEKTCCRLWNKIPNEFKQRNL